MRKWILVASLVMPLMAVAPASARAKAKWDSFQARAIPFPEMQADIYYPRKGSCLNGIDGVNKVSESFTAPSFGSLHVRMQGLAGDWDLYLLSKEGNQLGASTNAQILDGAAGEESITTPLRNNEEVEMVACNWLGEPQVSVQFAFSSNAR